MSPTGRILFTTLALGCLGGTIAIFYLQTDSNHARTNAGEDGSIALEYGSHVKSLTRPETAAPPSVAVSSSTDHPLWPDSRILTYHEDDRSKGRLLSRTWILDSPAYPNPIRVAERWYVGENTDPRMLSREEAIANRLIVRLKDGVSDREATRILTANQVRLIRELGIARIYLCGFENVEFDALPTLVNRLGRLDDFFEYVEMDRLSRESAIPNDPFFNRQWGKHNTGQDSMGKSGGDGVPGQDLDLIEAWNVIHDAPDVIVGILDSGVLYTHRDLRSNMWRNPGEDGKDNQGRWKHSNQIDDDENGVVDDLYGADFIDGDGDPKDAWGHGTEVAGVIGARGDNRRGISGVAWTTQIMALKVGNGGTSETAAEIEGIAYAIANGAKILNCSWGGSYYRQSLVDAFTSAGENGIIVVAAAGNHGSDNDSVPRYPAGYDLDNIVAVTAFDRSGDLASFSNYGEISVDIAAPGVEIPSTRVEMDENGEPVYSNNDLYGFVSGTSFSAPQVTGLLALITQKFPDEPYRDRINRLLLGAIRTDAFLGRVRSGGRASLAGSLELGEVGDLPEILQEIGDRIVMAGDVVELSVVVENSDGVSFSWTRDGQEIAGQDSNSIVIGNLVPDDLGVYRVIATNRFGSVTSTARVAFGPDSGSNIVYVNHAASGLDDGTSWTNAYQNLSRAIETAPFGAAIWIAGGDYRPDTSVREDSYVLDRTLGLYGGFAGTETDLSQRDLENNPTIISGEIGAADTDEDNLYHVFHNVAPTMVILDGLVIEKGRASNPDADYGPDNCGGAILNEGKTVSIRRCQIRNNNGKGYGGATFSLVGGDLDIVETNFFENTSGSLGGAVFSVFGANLDVIETDFRENTSGTFGGAIYSGSETNIRDSTFVRNFSSEGGGAILSYEGELNLDRCSFHGNESLDDGGAIVVASSTFTIRNTVFVGNRSAGQGGAVYSEHSSGVFDGNSVVSNLAGGDCGGILLAGSSKWILKNSVFWGNSGSRKPNLLFRNSRLQTLTHCLLETADQNGSSLVVGEDPLFMAMPSAGEDGMWRTGDDDYGNLRLTATSPAIDRGAAETANFLDRDGQVRPLDGDFDPYVLADIGAYEFSLDFDSWMRMRFGSAANLEVAAQSDLDDDRLTLAEEYALGGHPTQPDPYLPLMTVKPERDSGVSGYLFQYRRVRYRTDVRVEFQFSRDLVNWFNVDEDPDDIRVFDQAPGYEFVTIPVSTAVQIMEPIFGRITVSRIE